MNPSGSHQAATLWRVRVTVEDSPGALQRLAGELARRDANILSLHVHPLEQGARNELVVATPGHVKARDLLNAAAGAGGRDAQAWPTTALALADGQTKALALAARVCEDPRELPRAAAELLGAQLFTPRQAATDAAVTGPGPDETALQLPTPWTGTFTIARPDDPFTPAECARARQLAQIAEIAEIAARPGIPYSGRP